MWFLSLSVFILITNVNCLWDNETDCPKLCVCRLQQLSETSVHQYTKAFHEQKIKKPEDTFAENNEAVYDEEMHEYEVNSFVRSVTCIVQTETNTEELIDNLPSTIQSVTLIQALNSGNKTIKLSYFEKFGELEILELQSAQKLKENVSESYFICDVDVALPKLKYLNFEHALLKNIRKRDRVVDNEINDEFITFEYVQRVEGNDHPITFIRRELNEKIVPYEVFVEHKELGNVPLFVGFANLILLRIYDCELNNINWKMFENLNNLKYLLLEMNKIRFIPDFAFYGTPNLQYLSLAHNNLLNIQITDLAGLFELEYLDLSHNNFSQLSELSLPPFPKLKLANFANNPITVVFPNTFEVINTTDSLILGGLEESLTLMPNSFTGLQSLTSLIVYRLNIDLLKREIFVGMPNLKQLKLSGNITEIEYDTFAELMNLEILTLSHANITKLSIDSFLGLNNLRILDLSFNALNDLPPGIFEDLKNLRELYLNGNNFTTLPKGIFVNLHPRLTRLIRLNDNPWHCSCDMSEWKPMIVNRIKQKSIKSCNALYDKGIMCNKEDIISYKYVYDNRVGPKCTTPKKYENWSVFHVMRKQFKCTEFKPKLKKRLRPKYKIANLKRLMQNSSVALETSTEEQQIHSTQKLLQVNQSSLEDEAEVLQKSTEQIQTEFNQDNALNSVSEIENFYKLKIARKLMREQKMKKFMKKITTDDNLDNTSSSNNNNINALPFDMY